MGKFTFVVNTLLIPTDGSDAYVAWEDDSYSFDELCELISSEPTEFIAVPLVSSGDELCAELSKIMDAYDDGLLSNWKGVYHLWGCQ